MCLPQAAVSGEHAAVVTILDDSFLEDLGSTNGTLVNGKAVAKHFLRDRDEIDIGREILVYLDDVTGEGRSCAAADAERGARTPPKAESTATSTRRARHSPLPTADGDSGQAVDAIQRVVAAEIESASAVERARVAPPSAEAASVPAPPVQRSGIDPCDPGPDER